MSSLLRLPAGMWVTSRRPYFGDSMKNLKRNLPWGSKSILRDSERNHAVFESAGFELGPILGKGTFSTVVMGYWKHYKLNVAIKVYSKNRHLTSPALKMLPVEISMLLTLKHPNIVTFLGAYETKFRVYLVLELVGGGNLLDYILENDYVDEAQAKTWFAQLVSAVKYAHDMEVAHRDIKCENILLDMGLNIRLSDFGFATPDISWAEDVPNSGWQKDTLFLGSTAYMAPEILMRKPYSPLLADVWAVGVVLFCMVYGRFPFDNVPVSENNPGQDRDLVKMVEIPESPNVSPECRDVLKKIFVNENERIRSMELVEVDWISDKSEEIELAHLAKLTVHEVHIGLARAERLQALQELGMTENEDVGETEPEEMLEDIDDEFTPRLELTHGKFQLGSTENESNNSVEGV